MNNPFEIINDRLSNIETLLLDFIYSPKDSVSHPVKQKKLKKEQTPEQISQATQIHAQEVANQC